MCFLFWVLFCNRSHKTCWCSQHRELVEEHRGKHRQNRIGFLSGEHWLIWKIGFWASWTINIEVPFSDYVTGVNNLWNRAESALCENAAVRILSLVLRAVKAGKGGLFPALPHSLLLGRLCLGGDRRCAEKCPQRHSASRLPLHGGGISASEEVLGRLMSLPVSCFLFPASERLSSFRAKRKEANVGLAAPRAPWWMGKLQAHHCWREHVPLHCRLSTQ